MGCYIAEKMIKLELQVTMQQREKQKNDYEKIQEIAYLQSEGQGVIGEGTLWPQRHCTYSSYME